MAYVATSGGTVVVIDLLTGAVTATVNTGSGGRSVTIKPDGTILLVLCDDGTLKVIDITPGSPKQYQVTASVNTGSGGRSVTIKPDGALAYVTSADGNSVLVYSITASSITSASSISPGPSVVLTLIATIPVGQGPAGIAVDPRIVLAMLGHWVTGYLQPAAPFLASDIVLRSIRLNGVVPVDTSQGGVLGDHDQDSVPDLTVKFDRKAVALAVPDGDHVPVTVTGTVGHRNFVGTDTIRVVRFEVTAPTAGSLVSPHQPYTIRWQAPRLMRFLWVAVLHSFDRCATWKLDATHLSNSGSYVWSVPDTLCDSVYVAVVLVQHDDSDGSEVYGVLGVSDPFRIAGVLEVESLPAALAFEPIRPNPALGEAHMRIGLPRAADVQLEVFDLQGRKVRTLTSGLQTAGWHDVSWNGQMERGARSGAGLYFVRFRTEGREFRQRLVWLR